MKVVPISRWIRFSSSCICMRNLRIQRSERLVKKQHLWLLNQRARQRHSLHLAT